MGLWGGEAKMHTVNYYVILHYNSENAKSEKGAFGNVVGWTARAINFMCDDDTKTFIFMHKNCFK